ncbi:Cell division protein FtsI [Peptidoglycan synthetase] [hydrothermal vent metagenome]|uniref:Cell division protein FtsI [Peptidoglycan synthetase] n=1 Tax=hydrothermal vent metagenome TaxID=652676 RepID=A0A1W1C3H2_9ZZZZ
MNQQQNRRQVKQFFFLYIIIIFALLLFVGVILGNILSKKHLPSLYIKHTTKAIEGSIITADGFQVAKSEKLYKAVINTHYLDPDKKELFIALFSIYSGIPKKTIIKRLAHKKGVVVLSYNIPQKEAQYLKQLSYELRRFKVFRSLKNPKTGIYVMQGLSVLESGESRQYPYKTALTPVLGYPKKVEHNGYTLSKGVKGLEKRFEMELSPRSDGKIEGQRDVNGYILLNKDSYVKEPQNGLDIQLSINLGVQIRLEHMLDKMKKKIKAKEIFLAIMESNSGKVVALASSNRYLPKDIKRSDYPSLNTSAIEFSFEPGSVIKPITFSILLQKHLVNPYEIVNGHNGRFRIGRKVITDEHRFKWLSAEDVIVYSSNVGMAQLAQRLSGADFYEGLRRFGFAQKSTPDLVYERKGKILPAIKLENEIYKATTSYGYGMQVNLMQLLRAYSAFNNSGKIVQPYLVTHFIDNGKKIPLSHSEPKEAISPTTANRVKKILIKTVLKGTGKKAITPGLVIGGKTGTAHLVQKGHYVHKYNTSFLGFANDRDHRYTIGVVVRQPKTKHFASQTAVPVFKEAVDILIEEGFLNPDVIQ